MYAHDGGLPVKYRTMRPVTEPSYNHIFSLSGSGRPKGATVHCFTRIFGLLMSLGPLAYAPRRTATLRRPLVRFSTNNVFTLVIRPHLHLPVVNSNSIEKRETRQCSQRLVYLIMAVLGAFPCALSI